MQHVYIRKKHNCYQIQKCIQDKVQQRHKVLHESVVIANTIFQQTSFSSYQICYPVDFNYYGVLCSESKLMVFQYILICMITLCLFNSSFSKNVDITVLYDLGSLVDFTGWQRCYFRIYGWTPVPYFWPQTNWKFCTFKSSN